MIRADVIAALERHAETAYGAPTVAITKDEPRYLLLQVNQRQRESWISGYHALTAMLTAAGDEVADWSPVGYVDVNECVRQNRVNLRRLEVTVRAALEPRSEEL